jgi:hypothetical protein
MEPLQYEQRLLSRCIELAASYRQELASYFSPARRIDLGKLTEATMILPGETEAGTAGMQP